MTLASVSAKASVETTATKSTNCTAASKNPLLRKLNTNLCVISWACDPFNDTQATTSLKIGLNDPSQQQSNVLFRRNLSLQVARPFSCPALWLFFLFPWSVQHQVLTCPRIPKWFFTYKSVQKWYRSLRNGRIHTHASGPMFVVQLFPQHFLGFYKSHTSKVELRPKVKISSNWKTFRYSKMSFWED